MEWSDSLDILVGGVDVGSSDAEVLVVVLKYLHMCLDVVDIDGADGVDGVFDGCLGGLLIVTECFDAEVSVVVLK